MDFHFLTVVFSKYLPLASIYIKKNMVAANVALSVSWRVTARDLYCIMIEPIEALFVSKPRKLVSLKLTE